MQYQRSVRFFSRFAAILAAAAFLSLGGAARAQDSGVTTETFGVWATKCPENAAAVAGTAMDSCHAAASVAIEDNGADFRVMYLGVGKLPADKANTFYMFAMTPLGTYLPGELTLSVDGGTPVKGTFVTCFQPGCQAEIRSDEALVASMRSGKIVKATYTLLGRGKVEVPVSLDGFSAAVNALPEG